MPFSVNRSVSSFVHAVVHAVVVGGEGEGLFFAILHCSAKLPSNKRGPEVLSLFILFTRKLSPCESNSLPLCILGQITHDNVLKTVLDKSKCNHLLTDEINNFLSAGLVFLFSD